MSTGSRSTHPCQQKQVKYLPDSLSRIMLLALLFGCALWLADAAMKILLLQEQPFSMPLFLAILLQDLHERLLILACFCAFGALMAMMVSRQRRTQERLKSSEELLANVFESIKEGICILGPDLTVLRVNRVMKQWYQEMLPLEGKKCYASYHKSDRPCPTCPALRCLASGHAEQEILPGLAGSAVSWVEVYSYPLVDDSGAATGVVEFIRDITQKKRLEEEILKTKTIEATGILVGGIAHDFNNLLTAILGNVCLIKQRLGLDATVVTLLDQVDQAAGRMKDLVKRLVTFSTGGNPVKVPTAMERLLQETASLAIIGLPVRLEYDLAPELWPAAVDTQQISQVITAVIDNAREAMPSNGTIRLSAENLDLASEHRQNGFTIANGRYIKICIADCGTGIADADVPKVFDPYFSTKQRSTQKGMGLGLSAAYSIIKKHGGYIYLESRMGSGTSVYILLPAFPAEQGPPAAVAAQGPGQPTGQRAGAASW